MPPFAAIVHPFPSSTAGSCAYERGDASFPNALVFIGGLTAGPHSADLTVLFECLGQTTWSLWEFRMRSSYTGFGFSSLADDVEDISALVKYLRGIGKERVVIMGHSTGCQDCMEYLKRDGPTVEGYILLAPVSDREFAASIAGEEILGKTMDAAKAKIDAGKGHEVMAQDHILPVFASPVTAYRWWSLAAKGGDDDYFSSDLSDERLQETFGKINKPVLFLHCADDELVPKTVDRDALFKRWIKATPAELLSDLSGFVPADHAVTKNEMWGPVSEKVMGFLATLCN